MSKLAIFDCDGTLVDSGGTIHRALRSTFETHGLECPQRTVTKILQGGQPGPESSIGKLHWSKWHQRLGELEMDLMGADGQVLTDGVLGEFQYTFQFSRAHTIYAGSSEIQRNIVGERVLGLPREPG